MKNRILVVIFLIGIQETSAQSTGDSSTNRDSYIINSKTYRRGIYRSFEEFRYNSPSIIDSFVFDKKGLRLIVKNTNRRKRLHKSEVWGFSDGSKIYIRWNKYDPLVETGRYCYFIEKGTRVIPLFVPMIVPITYPYTNELIINYNTGKVSVLTKGLLKQILTSDDPVLLNEFRKEPQRGKKLREFIIKYNKRNVTGIK